MVTGRAQIYPVRTKLPTETPKNLKKSKFSEDEEDEEKEY